MAPRPAQESGAEEGSTKGSREGRRGAPRRGGSPTPISIEQAGDSRGSPDPSAGRAFVGGGGTEVGAGGFPWAVVASSRAAGGGRGSPRNRSGVLVVVALGPPGRRWRWPVGRHLDQQLR